MVDHLNPVERIGGYGRETYAPLPVGAMSYFKNMKVWQDYKKKHQEEQEKHRQKEKKEQGQQPSQEENQLTTENPLATLAPPAGQSPNALQMDVFELNIDDSRSNEQKYFSDNGGTFLQRARLRFFEHQFEAAEQDYKMYIRYHDTFGLGFEETLPEYFPAMFEYTLLLVVQDKSKEAHYFINQELAQFLTQNLASYVDDAALFSTVETYVTAQQQEEKLPGLETYNQRYSSKDTVALAMYMDKHGLHKIAEILLGFIKIRQLLKVFKTDLLIGNLPQSEPVKGGFYTTDLPLFYNFVGLSNL